MFSWYALYGNPYLEDYQMPNPIDSSVPAAGIASALPLQGSDRVVKCVTAIINGTEIPEYCLVGSLKLIDTDGKDGPDQIEGFFIANLPKKE